jgi:hypothetical protein
MPKKWVDYQIQQLLKVTEGTEIISVTRKPLPLGTNLIDTEPRSLWNIYMQMLRASKLATTKYVAMVEDDTLYSKEHFTEYRPPSNMVSYNRSRWSLFSWDPNPIYCMRQRISNCSLIAPRELLIEALEERARKHPNGHTYVGEVGRRKVDRKLRVTQRAMKEWYSTVPIIQLNHRTGSDAGGGPGRTKKHGQIKAIDIPYWGKARDIVKNYG